MKSAVLFLSFDGLTDPLGQSQVLPYLCGLSDEYSITIVSFEKASRFLSGKKTVEEICYQHTITWVPLAYHTSPPILCTLYDLWKLRRVVKGLHREQNFKIVHCRSYVTSLVGLWMKHAYKTKFIFDMRGFWADERVDGGLWNLKNPIYKSIYSFFKKKEKQYFNEADRVVSLTENAKNEIISWGVKTPIAVIPCCVDLKLFNPEIIEESQKQKMAIALGLKEGDFVLLYLGSLGTWYLVDEMLAFFSDVKKKRSDAKFLIITPDKIDISTYPYREDVLVKYAKRNEVPLYVSLASASVIFIKPSFSKKASSATKLAEILAMGKRLVVNVGWGDVSLYESQLAGVCTIADLSDYKKAIDWFDVEINSDTIRETARQHFSLDNGVALYKGIYQSLLSVD